LEGEWAAIEEEVGAEDEYDIFFFFFFFFFFSSKRLCFLLVGGECSFVSPTGNDGGEGRGEGW
jgi:hypothetical protein